MLEYDIFPNLAAILENGQHGRHLQWFYISKCYC